MNKRLDPVIIIGMHRSGTSLISRMLELSGLFVGWQKDTNNEAIFFLKINEWILSQCGARWDFPMSVKYLQNATKERILLQGILREFLCSCTTFYYLGLYKYLKYKGNLFSLDFSWGWKDPRNTFTLPLWLELFPEAKVIHVCRHGVDVANSLMARHQKILQSKANKLERLNNAPWLRPVNVKVNLNIWDSVRCSSIEGAFSLWEEYVNECRSHINALGGRAMEIKMEDILIEPYKFLKILVEFCRLNPKDEDLLKAASIVNADRAYAYQRDNELYKFSLKKREQLRYYGY